MGADAKDVALVKAKEAIVEAGKRYARTDVLRVVVRAIPLVGDAIDTMLTTGHAQIVEERTRYLLTGLSLDVLRLKEEAIDREYVGSPAFHDLMVAAVLDSAAARDREKIRLNARILAGAIQVGPGDDGDPEAHLDLIAGLKAHDLVVLRAIIAQQREAPTDRNLLVWANSRGWGRLQEQIAPVPVHDLEYRLHRLERAGCVREITGPYVGYPGGVMMLTDATRHLVAWIDRRGGFPTEDDVRAAEATE